jgi:hypothetical protein
MTARDFYIQGGEKSDHEVLILKHRRLSLHYVIFFMRANANGTYKYIN